MTEYPTIREAMTIDDIAELAGVKAGTISHYHKQGQGGLPEPKAVLAGRPIWEYRTIRKWLDTRQVGPGRPPRAT